MPYDRGNLTRSVSGMIVGEVMQSLIGRTQRNSRKIPTKLRSTVCLSFSLFLPICAPIGLTAGCADILQLDVNHNFHIESIVRIRKAFAPDVQFYDVGLARAVMRARTPCGGRADGAVAI